MLFHAFKFLARFIPIIIDHAIACSGLYSKGLNEDVQFLHENLISALSYCILATWEHVRLVP